MSKSRLVAAIEIGSSKIATLIAQVTTDPTSLENSINIVGVASIPSRGVKKAQVVNIEEVVEVTIASVEAAERMAGYNLDSAFLAIGGAHVTSQNTHGVVAVSDPGGEISSDDVDRVVEAASAISLPTSRDVIHVLPREFIVDGESGVRYPVGMSGVRLEVETHLVSASGAAVKNLDKAVNEVGVRIDDMVFAGFAAAQSTLTATEKELGCVLIDIGGGTTSITAFVDGSLAYSGVIPIGARNVTNDLAIGLRVSLETSEKIKIALSDVKKTRKGDSADSDQLDLAALQITELRKVSKKTLTEGIIKPRLNEIFTMVKLELDKVNLSTRVPSGVIVTGGGAETVGVLESAKRMLSLPVRLGKPKGIGGLIDDIITPAFAAPVGLIMYGATAEPTESITSFARRIKLPTKGIAGKFISTIRDLLP